MKTLISCLALALALGAASAHAATQEVEVTATGYGANDQEALGDALARAATQVNGGGAGMSTSALHHEINGTLTHSDGDQTAVHLESRTGMSSQFSGNGQIARYTVISSTRESEKRYVVEVKAVVNKYIAPGTSGNRDRIAVLPVRHNGGTVNVLGSTSSADFANSVGRSMESALIRTRAFQILDRVTLEKSLGELSLMSSDFTAPAERAKLQNLRGADYLILPTLDVTKAGERNPVTGQMKPAELTLELRVVVPATSEVAYTGSFPVRTKGSGSSQDSAKEVAMDAVRDLDTELHGSTSLKAVEKTEAADQGPRNDAGVKLPFDH